MATSGVKTLPCQTSSSYYLKLVWTRTGIDSVNARSYISVDFYVGRYSPYWDSARDLTASHNQAKITVNSSTDGYHDRAFDTRPLSYNSLGYDSESYLITKTFTIQHDAQGNATLSLRGDFSADDAGGVTGSNYITDSATLDNIPRGSVINSVSNFNLEDTFSVSVTKYSASFEDTLTIKYESTTIKTISDYEDEDAINLSDTEILAAYNVLGTNMSGSFTFNLTTKSGSTTIGTDSETATGTAKGTMYSHDGSGFKRAVPHINVGGTWKRCIAYFHDGTDWQRGIG